MGNYVQFEANKYNTRFYADTKLKLLYFMNSMQSLTGFILP